MGRKSRRFVVFGIVAGVVISMVGYFLKACDYGFIGAIAIGCLLGIFAVALAWALLERKKENIRGCEFILFGMVSGVIISAVGYFVGIYLGIFFVIAVGIIEGTTLATVAYSGLER